MKVTPDTVKAVIEERFGLCGIELFMPLHKIGIMDSDLEEVKTKLCDVFGRAVQVTLTDSVYTLFDKLAAQ